MKKFSRISIIIGTRPEAIKLAPVINKLKSYKNIDTRVVLTGQHLEMVEQVMSVFDLQSDVNLKIMKKSNGLKDISVEVMNGLTKDYEAYPPDLVIVQGDTTSAFIGALAAFYRKIPVAHVEAGLRTFNNSDPFPEEVNRKLISQIAVLHFAPTAKSKKNLELSNVCGEIFITGNTVIDALLTISEKVDTLENYDSYPMGKKLILTTIHRRENWGERLIEIARGILGVVNKHPEVVVVVPLHKNRLVRDPLKKILGNNKQIKLIEPLDYFNLVKVLKSCELVLTDSGGIQEEAPSLGKPVLILRKTTERPEAIESGTAKIIGTDPDNILYEVSKLLFDAQEYSKMSNANNPFGDGKASERIIEKSLSLISKLN